MKLANRTHKRKQKDSEPAHAGNMISIQEELNAITSISLHLTILR